MFNRKIEIIKGVIVMLGVVFLSACATSRYIEAPTTAPPELGISSSDDNLSVSVNSLILPGGPGSWVKGARWDEYVLTIRNLSDKPLTVEKIRLIDPRGVYIASGVNPGQLEKLSEAMIEEYKDMGTMVAISAAPSVVAGAAMAAGAFGAAAGMVVLAPVAIIAGLLTILGRSTPTRRIERLLKGSLDARTLATSPLPTMLLFKEVFSTPSSQIPRL